MTRSSHLVPVPKVATLAELNDRLRRHDRADDHRHISTRTRTVGEDSAAESLLLRPLPLDGFETGRWLSPLADR